MNFKPFFAILAAMPLVFTGCHPEQDPPVITAESITVSADAHSDKLTYSIENPLEGETIKAESNQDWIHSFDYSTENTINFEVDANISADPRTATLTLSYPTAQSITVNVEQMAAGESIALDPENLSFLPEGGELSVTVNSGRSWVLTGSSDWVEPSIETGDPGAEVVFTAKANETDEPREASFEFICGTNKVTLNVQQSFAGRILVEKAQYDIPGTANTFTVNIQSNMEDVTVEIPELKVSRTVRTDADGRVELYLKTPRIELWQPEKARLYDVTISSGQDSVRDRIGFRHVETDGTRILVNGVPTFMRSISFHEEIPQRMGRAFSQADAHMLLSEAEALGVNMIRLAHYPQNEYTVRLAEKMGFVLWQEIPIWQGIDFEDEGTREKALRMLTEMIHRDKNRCSVCFWGVANETKPSEARNAFLKSLLDAGRAMDTSRLYVAAFDLVYFNEETRHFEMDDPFTANLDVVAVNKYMGWYHPWPVPPTEAVWDVVPDKPLIISEFGGEALYGQHGDRNVTASWSEEYQARLYEDNIEMFRHIPNLAGVSPWILFDFRSPYRFHPVNQEGWNRKGLVSDRGYRKAAWYIMHDYYGSLRQ